MFNKNETFEERKKRLTEDFESQGIDPDTVKMLVLFNEIDYQIMLRFTDDGVLADHWETPPEYLIPAIDEITAPENREALRKWYKKQYRGSDDQYSDGIPFFRLKRLLEKITGEKL